MYAASAVTWPSIRQAIRVAAPSEPVQAPASVWAEKNDAPVPGALHLAPLAERARESFVRRHDLVGFRVTQRELDVAHSGRYIAAAVIGVVLMISTGQHGGELVYEHGINVKGADPLETAEVVSGEPDH